MAHHPVPEFVERLRSRALIVGAAALALALAAGFANPSRFFAAYLYAFLFWCGVPVGCLCLLAIQYLTGGRWGRLIRRVLEAATRTLPFVALAFLPVLFGLKYIYVWAAFASDPGVVTDKVVRHLLTHRQMYLNPLFFTLRAIFYFGVWCTIAYFLNRWSLRLDEGPNLRLDRRLRGLAGGALVMLGLTITFGMAVDWAMSLDPRWTSTIYGILFMVASVLTAFTLVILVVVQLPKHEPMRSFMSPETTHDLGKLLLAFTMLWAYVHLSQFLIVWSANLPEEIPWYMERMRDGWGVVGATVLVLHFALPFPMLLSRSLKRRPDALARIAGLIFVARLFDLFWVVGPTLPMGGGGTQWWLDALAAIGLGGLWLGVFAGELMRRPLLHLNDPLLQPVHSA